MICSRCKKIFEDNEYKTCKVCRNYNKNKREEVKIAFHWTNIRVIPKTENLKKYNKFCMIEYCNHILSVHKYISLNSKKFESLKSNIKYIKNKIFCDTFKFRELP